MKARTLYLLGHKITLHETNANFDLIELTVPSHTSGPPEHLHYNYSDIFLIIEGEMEFTINDKKRILKAGESMHIPKKTWHTFNNISNTDCTCVNIHRPKGFSEFFKAHGIPADEEDSEKNSFSEEIVRKIIETASDYDMNIKPL